MTAKIGIIEIPDDLNNPIVEPLKTLFLRINELNGLSFHLEDYVRKNRDHMKDSAKNVKSGFIFPFAGTTVVIRDLSEFPEDGWARKYAISVYSTQGNDYFNIADDLISQGAAWALSQAYEAFETFLKNILSAFITKNSKNQKYQLLFCDTVSHLKRKPKKHIQQEPLENNNLIIHEYFSNSELFELLRVITPEISILEKQNNRGMDLILWYKIITEVRHGITHISMLIKKSILNKFTEIERKTLNKMVDGTFNNMGYVMNPTYDNVKKILPIFDEYAFIIIKYLSKLENYKIPTLSKK
jgi:hypothetical protein